MPSDGPISNLRRSLVTHPRFGWLAPACLATALLSAGPARADCGAPDVEIVWTYPAPTQDVVPPDAVFWAVSPAGDVTVSVDGVPLSPLGTSPVERVQFAPAAPLGVGEHELVVRAEQLLRGAGADGGASVNSDERRFRFRVAAGPVLDGDVSIRSVEVYPVEFRGSPPQRVSPPPEDYDGYCTAAAIALTWTCNDTGGPSHLARVAYESEGAAIAYLVQGGYLVPRGCESFWAGASPTAGSTQFSAAAVLPTGLAEQHVFSEPVEFPAPDPGPFQRPPSACSLGLERRPAPGALLLSLTLAALGARARRRTRRSA